MKSLLAVFGVALWLSVGQCIILSTNQRIARYKYPAETHIVQTPDGYILTMFRIPYSPKLANQDQPRPVAFLQHGLFASSDCWILNGPNDGLAYLLADAGYDVWMGNARGNTYSRMNVYKSPYWPNFWDFSWHEIGVIDIPTMFDYVLRRTNQTGLHYVGHSQGTTVYFVLLSERPDYNKKIKTAHMLAPIAFMKYLKSPFVRLLAPLVGQPNLLSDLIGNNELSPSKDLREMLGSKACAETSLLLPLCSSIVFLAGGFDPKYLNTTLLQGVAETSPAGSSTDQVIHYVQEHKSGYFRQFDYGVPKNYIKYGQAFPPNYKLENIVAPTNLYYCDNDLLAAVVDVQKLAGLLPNVSENYHVPISKCNHLDFLWSLFVKDVLYVRIIDAANRYEQPAEQAV